MARIRTIKPEFFTSEDIVGLTPMARLLYVALWCECDKEGRMVWKPATFKLRYFPGDDCAIGPLCEELLKAKLVILYGEGYAYVPAFKAHQHINPRETPSQLPDPDACGTRERRVGTRGRRDSDAQGGREGKGKEGDTDASGFEVFWRHYPRKEAKQDALKAWLKLAPNEVLQGSILKAVALQSQGEDWRKEGGRFVPHPATYLNGQRWTDEVIAAAKADAGKAWDGAI